ncbi:membrane protein [Microbacterium phage CaptainRex]|nr:membrane protein [Microbacterium phage Zepp]UVK59183.1 membrane protein [Microbacterium phage Librie]WIC89856.1 membrane protein [Microbacterium phage CaptainRex]
MNWTDPWVPGFVTGSIALVAAIATGIITSLFAARLAAKNHARASAAPGAPTVQQVWERQDRMERALGAALTLVGELVEQHDNPGGLRLSPSAIKILRETNYMPTELEDVLQENESNKNKE